MGWKTKFLSVTLLAGGILSSGCAYKHRSLVSPQVEILQSTSLENVRSSITKVARSLGWKIEKEEPNRTVLLQKKHERYARVQMDYTESQITIRHLQSAALNYSKDSRGRETIHSRYLIWAKNLRRNLEREVNGSR